MMAAEYNVISIDEMVRPGEVGGVEKFYRHRIKTKGKIVLTVDISEKDFTPEKSAPILLAAALNADKIKAL